jgi:hypothetical protein
MEGANDMDEKFIKISVKNLKGYHLGCLNVNEKIILRWILSKFMRRTLVNMIVNQRVRNTVKFSS